MQITLNQKEIEAALKNFVGQQGINIENKKSDVTLIAGRSPNGMSAVIDIIDYTYPTCPPAPSNDIYTTTATPVETHYDEPPFNVTEESVSEKPLFGN